jgi:hypothetical protein
MYNPLQYHRQKQHYRQLSEAVKKNRMFFPALSCGRVLRRASRCSVMRPLIRSLATNNFYFRRLSIKSRARPPVSRPAVHPVKFSGRRHVFQRERLKYTAAEGHPSRRVEMRVCEWNTLGLERATFLPLPNVRDACTLFAAAVGACLSQSVMGSLLL